jgi:hypothetical protein
MAMSRPPDPQAALVRVPRALLGSSAAILVVAAIVNSRGRPGSGELEVTSSMAVAWAALAPVVATIVRKQGLVAPPPAPGETDPEILARLQKTIVFFGVLESAVVLAAAALIVSAPPWPFAAALFPLGVMAFNLPSRPA